MKLDRRILNRTIEIVPIVLILAFILLNSTAFTGFSVYNFVSGENLSINPIEELNLSIPVNETQEEINLTELTFEIINDTGITILPYEAPLTISAVPTHSSPIINSTSGLNTTSENLTAYNNSAADTDDDRLKHIWNWWVDNESIAIVNMPFEGNGSFSNILNTTQTADYSGRGNHGNLLESPIWDATGGHDGFGAFVFSDLGDKIDLGDVNGSDSGTQLTVSYWMLRTSTSIKEGQIVKWDDAAGSTGNSWGVRTANDNGADLFIFIATDDDSGGNLFIATDANVDVEDEWAHIAFVYDGSGSTNADRLKVYKNGVQLSGSFTGTIPSSLNDGPEGVVIGRRLGAGASQNGFNGNIDDVMIFNRSLSASQILEIYQGLNRTGLDLITSDETSPGEYWKVSLTLNDGLNDSKTLNTSELYIKEVYTEFLNAANDTGIESTQNITLNITITDIRGLANYSLEWSDSGSMLNVSNFSIPSGYITWDANESVKITASASTVIDWRYYACDISNNCNVSNTFNFTVKVITPPSSSPTPSGGSSERIPKIPKSPTTQEEIEEEPEEETPTITPITEEEIIQEIIEAIEKIIEKDPLIKDIIDIVNAIDYPSQEVGITIREDKIIIEIGNATETIIEIVDNKPIINIELTKPPKLIKEELNITQTEQIQERKPSNVIQQLIPWILLVLLILITLLIIKKTKHLWKIPKHKRINFNKELNYINGLIITNRLDEAIKKYRDLVGLYNTSSNIEYIKESREIYIKLRKLNSVLKLEIFLQEAKEKIIK